MNFILLISGAVTVQGCIWTLSEEPGTLPVFPVTEEARDLRTHQNICADFYKALGATSNEILTTYVAAGGQSVIWKCETTNSQIQPDIVGKNTAFLREVETPHSTVRNKLNCFLQR